MLATSFAHAPPDSSALDGAPQVTVDPDLWSAAIEGIADDVTLIVREIYEIDLQIESLRQGLQGAQPFGSRKIDVRWYLESRPNRRDPVPIRYVKNSDYGLNRGLPVWAVVRLDRGINIGKPLHKKLRTNGPLADRKDWLIAAKVCRKINALIKQRKQFVAVVAKLRQSAGTTAAALRKAHAPKPPNPLV